MITTHKYEKHSFTDEEFEINGNIYYVTCNAFKESNLGRDGEYEEEFSIGVELHSYEIFIVTKYNEEIDDAEPVCDNAEEDLVFNYVKTYVENNAHKLYWELLSWS